jgi:hypothetical protein
VATHQVVVQLWLFLALVVDALALADQSLVARYVGLARPAPARAVATGVRGDRFAGQRGVEVRAPPLRLA